MRGRLRPTSSSRLSRERLASYKRPSRRGVRREIPRLPSGKVLAPSAEGACSGRPSDQLNSSSCGRPRPSWPTILGPGSVADLDDDNRDRSAGEGRRRDGISHACAPTARPASGGDRRRGVQHGDWSTSRSSARCSPTTWGADRLVASRPRRPRSRRPVDLTRSVAGVVESPPELG